jgi:poly(hydroxyalkanoate) depolymerase family esterase
MREAIRLTRAGQLLDATAAIQRALRGNSSAGSPADDAIEGVYQVVEPARPPREAGSIDLARLQLPTPSVPPTAPPIISDPPLEHERIKATAPAARPVARPERPPTTADAGGQFLAGSYTNDAGTRPYKLYIPSSYRGQALPLIIMLHGCTQTPDDFAAGTRMNMLAEEHGYFVAYPAQPSTANGSKCWNWFKAADQQRGQGEPALIAGITRQIGTGYQIDPRRIYVAGLSSGGAMAVIMGATYPDLYAAIGCHSGLAYAVAHDLPSALAAMQRGSVAPAGARANTVPRAIPTIVFHGDRDTTVHPRNADQVIAQGVVPDTVAGAKPRVIVQQGQVSAGQAYTRTIYHDASGQASMEQWQIHGAGHAWSGGSPSGSFTNPKGPDATREILRFFAAHPAAAHRPAPSDS